tara:strand:- start:2681 stop:3616 length:936 start_codon:yes stop_codon:yes gene_type:complete
MNPICITIGDIAGIGPEVIIKSLKQRTNHPPIIIFLHESVLNLFLKELSMKELNGDVLENNIYFFISGKNHHASAQPNHPNNANIAFDALNDAISYCKKYKGSLVTAPISKAGFLAANIPFTGHTTLLKTIFNCPNASMAFYSDKLKILLATIHIPLSKVESKLTSGVVKETLVNAEKFANQINIKKPTIGIAGLNPHASENGQFGTFENQILTPVIKSMKKPQFIGPVSPDVIFRQALSKQYDIVVAMYHDQGLIPLKLLSFDSAVNVTIGLPICRTSPDHGTAYDIAGKNKANPNSMIAAIDYAIQYGQ